jgi:hypothetical protein
MKINNLSHVEAPSLSGRALASGIDVDEPGAF